MRDPVRIVPLGGLDEVGERNCYAIIYGKDAILLDCGQKVPSDQVDGENLGPEYFPDFSLLLNQGICIRAVLVSHAHLDHVGALPYLYEHIIKGRRSSEDAPLIVSSYFAREVINSIVFKEYCRLKFTTQRRLRMGPFQIHMFPVMHSTPGSRGFSVHVGGKHIVYLGDCKLYNGVPRRMVEEGAFLHRLQELGAERVDALLLDSTNVDKAGHTPRENDVLGNIAHAMAAHPDSRIVISTFSSHIDRLEHIIAAAFAHGRPVFAMGSNMKRYMHIARIYPWEPYSWKIEGTETFAFVPRNGIVLATGAQAEPGSALMRFTEGDLHLPINPARDIFISASSTIPKEGIVERVEDMMEALSPMFYRMYLGPNVRTREEYPNVQRGLYHASGHASREDLREILAQTSPRLVIPVHAERERREMIGLLMPARSAIRIAEEGEEIVL